jgi:hypothetical protein
MRLNNLEGRVIGRLLVQGRAADYIQPNGRKRVQWNCICICGGQATVEAGNLSTGHTQSCGCLVADMCAATGSKFATHRQTKTREWYAWVSAQGRCNNPNTSSYKYYGARGVTFCKRWTKSFENFYSDMGACASGLSLERKDVNRGYEPSNCRWASAKDQARNKRSTIRVTYQGIETSLAALAESMGLEYRITYERYQRQGWSIEKTVNTPTRLRKCSVPH